MESPTTTSIPIAATRTSHRPITRRALLWHVIRHDLRGLWPYAVLCLAAALLGYTQAAHAGNAGPGHFWRSILVQFSVMPYWILLGSLLPLIVQSDAPIGTNGFLMTRPISSSCLLMAKLIQAVVLFLVVTLSIHASFLAEQGFTGSQIAEASERFSTALLLAFVWGTFLASVTKDVFQFWLLVISLIVAANVWSAWGPTSPSTAVRDLDVSQGKLNLYVITAGLFGLTFWQHRRRKPIHALIASGVLVFAASQLTSYWPWTFPWVHEEAPPVEALSWPHTVVKGPLFSTDYQNHVSLLLTEEVALPPGEIARFDEMSGKVQWTRNAQQLLPTTMDRRPMELGCREAVQALLGNDFNVTVPPYSLDRRLSVNLGPRPTDDRIATSFHGAAKGNRVRLSLLGRVPLQAGARLSKDGRTVVVQEVPQPGNDVHLSIWERGLAPAPGKARDELRLVVLNASRKEAHVLSGANGTMMLANLIPDVAMTSTKWNFGPGHENNSADLVSTAWLAGAELAIFVEHVGNPVSLDLSCSIPSDYFPPLLSPSEREKAKQAIEGKMRARIQTLESSVPPP